MELDGVGVTLREALTSVGSRILEFLPNLLGAAILLLGGWLAAWLLARATDHVAQRAAARLATARQVPDSIRRSSSYRNMPAVASRLVFWIVLLFFAAAAIEALGLPAVSNVVGWLTAYLPRLLAAVIVLALGIWAGQTLREFLVAATDHTGLTRGPLLARLAQVLIIALAVVVAVEQLGIDTTVIIILVSVVFGTTLGAMAIAFAVGAAGTVGNIVAAHYAHQHYHPGDQLRIGEVEGTVVEVGRTALILDGSEGRIVVPARRLNDDITVISRAVD